MNEISVEYAKAYVLYHNMTAWSTYHNNPECVKNMLYPQYWAAIKTVKGEEEEEDKFGLYLFLGVAIGAVVVIAVLLLVIYMKKGKSEEEEGTTSDPMKVETKS